MVTILPVRGQELVQAVYKLDGYDCGTDQAGWVVSEGGEEKGYLLFSLPDSCVTRLYCPEPVLADGLLKTAADFVWQVGGEVLLCRDNRPENHGALKAAGFRQEGDLWKINPGKVLRACKA